jgi:hypothetical protein
LIVLLMLIVLLIVEHYSYIDPHHSIMFSLITLSTRKNPFLAASEISWNPCTPTCIYAA